MRRPVVAVIGGHRASPRLREAAEALGRGIVDAGWRVACGGRGGVMEAACRGAHGSAAYREGDTLGILPSGDPAEANPFVDVVLPTGLGLARNVLVVRAGDAIVAVGGGAGTLSELAYAWQFRKPVVALDLGEGWSAELADRSLDDRFPGRLHRADSVDGALTRLRSWLGGS